MQTERLFEIVYTLLDRGTVTAQELADKLNVSKRTILRDIETLALAKVPVYTTQGKGGGVSLLDGYVLDKAVLSDEEKEQILLGIKTLLPTGNASDKALSKLGSLFAVKNTDWIEIDFSRWSNPKHDREKFDTLKDAIMQRKTLAFSYPNSTGEISKRKAYPLKLVFQGQAWYIQAFCLLKKDYRTFKINRMIDLQVLPETFEATLYTPPPVVPQSIQRKIRYTFGQFLRQQSLIVFMMNSTRKIYQKMRTAPLPSIRPCLLTNGYMVTFSLTAITCIFLNRQPCAKHYRKKLKKC